MFIQVILIFMLCGQIFSIDHAFYMKIKHDGSVTRKINGEQVKLCVKKVWVDLVVQGQYIFRRNVNSQTRRTLLVLGETRGRLLTLLNTQHFIHPPTVHAVKQLYSFLNIKWTSIFILSLN